MLLSKCKLLDATAKLKVILPPLVRNGIFFFGVPAMARLARSEAAGKGEFPATEGVRNKFW